MMHRITGLILFLGLFTGCQKVKPATYEQPKYLDFETLQLQQAGILKGLGVEKRVSLDDKQELQQFKYDSTDWVKELDFLSDINPNQAQYVGAFDEWVDADTIKLTLKAGESDGLKQLFYLHSEEGIRFIHALFHEEKDVYVHHRNIILNFEEGRLLDYRISGYQKMIFNDTVTFEVSVRID